MGGWRTDAAGGLRIFPTPTDASRFAFSADAVVPKSGECGLTCYYDENSFVKLVLTVQGVSVDKQSGMEVTHVPCTSIAVAPPDKLSA